MAIFDLLISLTKNNSDSLYKFKKCVQNILNLQDIPTNLNLIYDYISYEQSKMVDYKCTEYFINNEISLSFIMIPNIEYFFIKIISVLNKEYLNKFVTINLLQYSSKLSLIYSERLVVYNLEIKNFYLKYLTDNFYKDKYFRYATIHIFELENVFDKLEKNRFKNKLIQYLNKENDDQKYINIYEMYMMLILKEKLNKKINFLDFVPNTNEKLIKQNQIKFVTTHECINYEDINIKNLHKRDELTNLKLENKSINLYKNLLKINIVDKFDKIIIKWFIDTFDNKNEHIEFLKYLMDVYPILIGELMSYNKDNNNIENDILDNNKKDNILDNNNKHIKNIKNDNNINNNKNNILDNNNKHIKNIENDNNINNDKWKVQDIYKIICKKRKKYKPYKYYTLQIDRYNGNLFQKLINLNIQDEEIYLFVYIANRSLFFSKFNIIDNLMNDNEYFYGTLMKLIIRK